MTAEELRKMRDVDVRTVDRGTLVDIKNVSVNQNEPVEKRIKSFIRQIQNPYCFMVDGVVVKVAFTDGGKTFEEQFKSMLLGFS